MMTEEDSKPRGQSEREGTRLSTVPLSDAQRAALRVDPLVSDELIDDAFSSIAALARWPRVQSGILPTPVRRGWEAKQRAAAQTVEAFRRLMEEDNAMRAFLAAKAVSRGADPVDAAGNVLWLYVDLAELVPAMNARAVRYGPRPGIQPDERVLRLAHAVRRAWYRHVGAEPGISETGPFTRFCAALGDLVGLEIDADKLRAALQGRDKDY